MSVYTVPQSDWAQFCQDFSTRHTGEPITIESLSGNESDSNLERTIVSQDCPLHSLRLESTRTGEDILVLLGRGKEDASPQFVVAPRQIRLEQPDTPDEPGRLRIDIDDDQVILLHLPVPVLPGILNGV